MLPFFYYEHCTVKSIEKYLFFINNVSLDIGSNEEYYDYYRKMYGDFYQNDKYFELLHEIFRTKKIEYVPDHLQIFEEFDQMRNIHRKLVLSFDIYNRNSIANYHNNITKKALKNILCEVKDEKSYFMPQIAGSCAYKSLLMTWLIYCIFSPKYVPGMIYEKYVEYTNTFSLSIESIIN
jgi:hypothetical protein